MKKRQKTKSDNMNIIQTVMLWVGMRCLILYGKIMSFKKKIEPYFPISAKIVSPFLTIGIFIMIWTWFQDPEIPYWIKDIVSVVFLILISGKIREMATKKKENSEHAEKVYRKTA